MESNSLDWKTVFKKILLKDSVSEENGSSSCHELNSSSEGNSIKTNNESDSRTTNSTYECHVENLPTKWPNQNTIEEKIRSAESQISSTNVNDELKCNANMSEYNLSTNAVKYEMENPSSSKHDKFHNKHNTLKDISRKKWNSNYGLQSKVASVSAINVDSFCKHKEGINRNHSQSEGNIHYNVVNNSLQNDNVQKNDLKPFPSELPIWNHTFKEILGEKNLAEYNEPSISLTMPMPVNKDSESFRYMKSHLPKQNIAKPKWKGKPNVEKKRELTKAEKDVDRLRVMSLRYKPAPILSLNDFEGAGINIFKTQDENDKYLQKITYQNDDDHSGSTYSLNIPKRETVECNASVEWTKLTRYTFQDAMAAKDKIVLDEVWELDDSFSKQCNIRRKYPVRVNKRCYK